MYKLEIHKHEKLVVAEYASSVTMAEVIEVTQKMITHPDYNPSLDGVSDYRNGNILFSVQEITAFADEASKNKIAAGRWCMLVSRPQETALLAIFKEHVKAQHPIELFCTLKAASEYLGKDLSKYLPLD